MHVYTHVYTHIYTHVSAYPPFLLAASYVSILDGVEKSIVMMEISGSNFGFSHSSAVAYLPSILAIGFCW